jgi:hypothetical protein
MIFASSTSRIVWKARSIEIEKQKRLKHEIFGFCILKT